jgi:polar amino acid transport system permease protein
VRCFCKTYVSFYRGTPLLVQLILIFYALPAVGITLSPLAKAVMALSLNTAAFQGEISLSKIAAVVGNWRAK